MKAPNSLRRRLAFLLLATGALAVTTPAGVASAHVGVCRTDPVVFLSNDTKIQLSAEVADNPSDIRAIPWTLNVPAGVTVTQVVYTQGRIGKLETLQVTSSNSAANYDADVTMVANTDGIGVQATVQYVDQGGAYSVKQGAQGLTNQHLHVQVSH